DEVIAAARALFTARGLNVVAVGAQNKKSRERLKQLTLSYSYRGSPGSGALHLHALLDAAAPSALEADADHRAEPVADAARRRPAPRRGRVDQREAAAPGAAEEQRVARERARRLRRRHHARDELGGVVPRHPQRSLLDPLGG